MGVPINAYPSLVIALVVAPALVTGIIVLLLVPDAPPITGWLDALGYVINGAFALLIWGIGIRVFLRTRSGEAEAGNLVLLLVAKYQPALWIIGIAIGVFGAISMSGSYNRDHAMLMSYYCDAVIPEEHPRRARCSEVIDACDQAAESGPCGEITSTAQADHCMQSFNEARNALTDEELALMPELSGDYDKAMRAVCVLERTR